MRMISELMPRRWRTKTTVVLPVLILLVLISGCATGKRVEPEPMIKSPAESRESVVMRFEDGRTGFVISETAQMSAAARRDFDSGVLALEAEDFETALEFLDRVIDQAPEVSAPYVNIAKAYSAIDRPQLAEEHLTRALELVAGHPLASHEYGLLLRRAGRFSEAQSIYEQSLEQFPEYHPVRRNLGILCDLYLNDLECALEQYEAYSEVRPEDQQVKIWISELRGRLGR